MSVDDLMESNSMRWKRFFQERASRTDIDGYRVNGFIDSVLVDTIHNSVRKLLTRYRYEIVFDCGCGDEPSPISTFLVGRNLFLLALAYIASKYIDGSPSLNWNTLIFTTLSAGLFYGVYMIFEQLMTNRGRHIRLWLGEQS